MKRFLLLVPSETPQPQPTRGRSRRLLAAALLLGTLLPSLAAADGGSTFVVGTFGGTFDSYAQDAPSPSSSPTTVERGGTFKPVTGTGSFLVKSAAERGRLRAYATTTLHNSPGFVSMLQWSSFGEMHLRDLHFTGPTGATSVSASLNLRVDGDLVISNEHAAAVMDVGVGGSGYAGATRSRFSIGNDALSSGLFAGLSGSSIHRSFTTGTFQFAVGGGANFVDLRLDAYASCSSNTWSVVHATAVVDVHDEGNGLSFDTGPVFNLPPGYTVNSADGLIVDNRWVDPTQAAIQAPANHVQECDSDVDGATVLLPFTVKAGGADLLRARNLTMDSTLLEVQQPVDGAYVLGPVTFPHGASTVLIELLRGAAVLASASVTIQIQDTTAPSLTGCHARTLEASDLLTPVSPASLAVAAEDDCDPAPLVTLVPDLLPLGTTSVTATARDATGNTTHCTFEVTVVDTLPPTFLVRPADVERECAGPLTTVAFDVLAVDLGVPVAIECRDQDDARVDPEGSGFAVGEHLVTCTARDGRGNETACTFRITILDVHAPTLLCPGDVVAPTDPDRCSAHVAFAAQATDDCDPTVEPWFEAPWGPVESGDEFPCGTTPVTAYARDLSGNLASCTFAVIVRDLQPPVLSGPTVLTLVTDCAGSPLPISALDLGVGARDACDPMPRIEVSPSALPPGVHLVVCTATDADGNRAERRIEVTVWRGPFDVRVLRPLDGGVDNLIHAGRVVPLRITVRCENVFEPGATARVLRVERLDGAGSPVGNVLVDEPGGTADDGDLMRLALDEEEYVYQLSTKDWPTTSGARFRVSVYVDKEGHRGAIASFVLRNR